MSETKTVTRRTILKGSVALGAVTLSSGAAMANLFEPISAPASSQTNVTSYFCDAMHQCIADRLDNIIASPQIDGEQTALAIMDAHCPLCAELIAPKTSSIRAT